MSKFYDYDIIPLILKYFKIKNIVISGVKEDVLINSIANYQSNFVLINTDKINDFDILKGNPLDVLPNLNNYDAIFIDDDSNWYTIFNELNIIKNTNENFPLVFVCNNKFPNKRRDSYSQPNNIPKEFRHKYVKELPICYNGEEITIFDGFYHACKENTPKNGVLTAIEDFLKENSHIGLMKINFIEDITILYNRLPINQKRIENIFKDIQDMEFDDFDLSTKLIENKLLISYINKYNIFNEKLNDYELEISNNKSIILNYENEMRAYNNELNYKNSKINNFETKLNLKDAQIKNFESKLVNKDAQIKSFESKLVNKDAQIKSFESKLVNKDKTIDNLKLELQNNASYIGDILSDLNEKDKNFSKRESQLNNQISTANSKITSLTNSMSKKEKEFNDLLFKKNSKIEDKNIIIQQINDELNDKENQISQIDQKYSNKLKNKQHELNERGKQITQLNKLYVNQISKNDHDKYCINCFKDEINNNHAEIEYLKNNTLIKKILNPFSYIYLILKSKPNEISINFKLLKALKNSKCFDIGFYLNNNPDIQNSNWCKYFSPELHYVCKGFNEERTFNKKFFNRNSKNELLDYLLNCDE